jgi:hypothetical protein
MMSIRERKLLGVVRQCWKKVFGKAEHSAGVMKAFDASYDIPNGRRCCRQMDFTRVTCRRSGRRAACLTVRHRRTEAMKGRLYLWRHASVASSKRWYVFVVWLCCINGDGSDMCHRCQGSLFACVQVSYKVVICFMNVAQDIECKKKFITKLMRSYIHYNT